MIHLAILALVCSHLVVGSAPRRLVGSAMLSLSLLQPQTCLAHSVNHPSKEEIQSVFSSEAWRSSSYEPSRDDFQRLDESPDSLFYKDPRFVEHIDKVAVDALTSFHGRELQRLHEELSRPVEVLDLCSSWVSHIPKEDRDITGKVVGLGMNEMELKQNPLLSQYVVKDLNADPKLPFEDSSFDLVLIQLSIDYLIQPVQVLKEVGRVIRPSGDLAISFSNRVFIDKAVSIWTGKPDIEHIETVGDYIKAAGMFREPFEAIDLLPKPTSDPLYVVKAYTL